MNNLSSFTIKIVSTIKFIPKKVVSKKNVNKIKKKCVKSGFIECDDKYIRKIIENGGL